MEVEGQKKIAFCKNSIAICLGKVIAALLRYCISALCTHFQQYLFDGTTLIIQNCMYFENYDLIFLLANKRSDVSCVKYQRLSFSKIHLICQHTNVSKSIVAIMMDKGGETGHVPRVCICTSNICVAKHLLSKPYWRKIKYSIDWVWLFQ